MITIKKEGMLKWILMVCIMAIAGQSQAQKTNAYLLPAGGVTEMYDYLVRYQADLGSLSRFYTISGSPEKRQRFLSFYKEYLDTIEKLPFERFSTGGKIDWLLLKRNIENEIFLLHQEADLYEEI
ncbi:MAG: hypothetical protein MUE71_06520, partial [Chitinophagaceae bacterium]|nr:hypothetical protein [Chitinophagaceae bacterium]